MGTLFVLKSGSYEKVTIDSWDEFKKQSATILSRSVIDGIKFFFAKGDCGAQQIFDLLIGLEDGVKIWGDIEYFGGCSEGYFAEQIRASFLLHNGSDDSMCELYGLYLKKPQPAYFE